MGSSLKMILSGLIRPALGIGDIRTLGTFKFRPLRDFEDIWDIGNILEDIGHIKI